MRGERPDQYAIKYTKLAKDTPGPGLRATARAPGGGTTLNTTEVSSGLYTKDYLESLIEVALGGRIAEEVIFI